jgi:pimeloyl-ACP methyl ester carboxylesterase/predicted acylesterase/phospholipase RssA
MPRIGLVLGAGGATGHAFHVAVLSALEAALGWDAREADVIVGTSAGAVVGALLRGGLSPRDLAARALGEDLSAEGDRIARILGKPEPAPAALPAGLSGLFMAAPELLLGMARRPWEARLGPLIAAALPAGRISTDHLVAGIRRLLPSAWPTRPLWINAVRLDDGRRAVFGREAGADPEVATAVAASCAIPGYYRPVEIGGVHYVDGGAHSPTNADLLAAEGLDLVIVSSPMSAAVDVLRPAFDLPARGLFRYLLRGEMAAVRRGGTTILAFEPDVEDRRVMGFRALDGARRHAVIRQVRASTLRRLEDPTLRGRLSALEPPRPEARGSAGAASSGVSRVAELGIPVHYVDYGGSGPAMVLVHGLGGAHVNWMAVGGALARRARVVAIDLPGFGRTPSDGVSASIHANRLLLDRVITRVVGAPAIVVGNSMGGLIGMIEAAERPEHVAGLVLVCAAMPTPLGPPLDALVAAIFAGYFLPGVGEILVRGRKWLFGPEGSVKQLLALCCVDAGRIPPEIVAATVELSRERLDVAGGHAAFLEAARSLVAYIVRRGGFDAMIQRIVAPTLVVHGAEDRLVPVAAARALAKLRPDWSLQVLEDCGHVPQLEHPAAFVAAVEAWLDGAGQGAAATA